MSLNNLTKRDIAYIQRGFSRVVKNTLNMGIPITYAQDGAVVRKTRKDGVDSIEFVKWINPPADAVSSAQINWRGW